MTVTHLQFYQLLVKLDRWAINAALTYEANNGDSSVTYFHFILSLSHNPLFSPCLYEN